MAVLKAFGTQNKNQVWRGRKKCNAPIIDKKGLRDTPSDDTQQEPILIWVTPNSVFVTNLHNFRINVEAVHMKAILNRNEWISGDKNCDQR